MPDETTEHLLGEVMLFEPVMQQTYLLTEFDRIYHPIASIQPGAPIEFFVKNAEKLYLDLNNSFLRIRLQIKKKDNTNMPGANDVKTAPINNFMHSLFKDVTVQLNNKTVTDPSNMYPYRAYLETLINYSHDVQKYRLLSEGWVRDTADHMDEDTPTDNKGLVERKTYATDSAEVELIGRPHVDIFHCDKLIPPGIDMSVKCIPNDDKFVLMCGDAANLGPKIVIKDVALIIHTKQMNDATELAHRALIQERNMRLPYTRVLMKHMAIPANSSTISLDNLFTGGLPDLVVMGFVSDDAFAGNYNRNPFNFQNFKIKRVDMFRNGMRVPRYGYTPNFTTKTYMKDYFTFQGQLGYDTGDKCVNITPVEWSNGYTLYAFKLTDGPIGSGTVGPRSHSESGSVRLEFDFETAPTANLKLIIMYQMLGVIEIDQFNNIIVS